MSARPLRVLLGVAWYLPESIGGTEKYVRGLAMELRAAGIDVAVAVPRVGARAVTMDVQDGVPVYRFAPTQSSGLDLVTPAPEGWREVLASFQPTIVDVHSLTGSIGLPHLRAAREFGARTAVTVHLPGLVCARGTLQRFGHEPCDGDLMRQPCTACRLEARGVPAPVGALLSDLPSSVSTWLGRLPVPDLARRAVAADDSHRDRIKWLAAIDDHTDRIVVVSSFLKAMLTRNNISGDKIVVCRQGVDRPATPPRRSNGLQEPGTLKVGFVGRFEPMKGLDVLLDAAERLPADARIEFHIWGLARTPETQAYRATVVRNAQSLGNVYFRGEADSYGPYEHIDVLAVPSIWAETGPFVVLEAQAVGVPVVGSDLGGIAERVTSGRDGVLFPTGDAEALAAILLRLWRDPAELSRLRSPVPVRTIADVARETLETYTTLAAERAA
jgi:glycosyltransferase involved in cell wall biosynthesis